MDEIEAQVFKLLCKAYVDVMNKGYPIPSTIIAKRLHITLYKARKALKSLKEKGLVISLHTGMYDEMSEQTHLLSGYQVTEKAKETREYKKAVIDEIQLLNKVFGYKPAEG